MARIYKSRYKVKDGSTRKTENWYVEFRDHKGLIHRLPGYRDKKATEELAHNVERLVSLRAAKSDLPPQLVAWLHEADEALKRRLSKWDLLDSRMLSTSKALVVTRKIKGKKDKSELIGGHVWDFMNAVQDNGSAMHRAMTLAQQVQRACEGCGFKYWQDIDEDQLSAYLAKRRPLHERGPVPTGGEPASCEGRI